MRTRWIIAAVLVVIGAVWVAQGLGFFPGSGFMDGDSTWAVDRSGPGRGRGRRRLDARQDAPPAGLTQPAQVSSAGPTVTSSPWRASGSRRSRGSACSRATIPASSRLR